MDINRNNYEEFFVMYADNELSGAEKQLVESFVNANPDLRQELELLTQTRLIADPNIVFQNKDLLMRSSLDTSSVINQSNYEEFFLLYLDNELNDEDKIAVEKFADKHPLLWHEMMLLQKARIEPDHSIVYAGKEKLHRKEERKIIFLPWQRIAAAAVILLIAGTVVFKYMAQKTDNTVATGNQKIKPDSTIVKKNDQLPVTSLQVDTLQNRNTATTQSRIDNKVAQTKKVTPASKNIAVKKMPIENETLEQGKQISPVVVKNENIDTADQINTDKINIPTDAVATIKDAEKQTDTNQQTQSVTRLASFTDQPEPESTNVLAFSTKKNKMRGIFRKVSRVFEKTTNVDGDKSSVLIGSFQIAVK